MPQQGRVIYINYKSLAQLVFRYRCITAGITVAEHVTKSKAHQKTRDVGRLLSLSSGYQNITLSTTQNNRLFVWKKFHGRLSFSHDLCTGWRIVLGKSFMSNIDGSLLYWLYWSLLGPLFEKKWSFIPSLFLFRVLFLRNQNRMHWSSILLASELI